MILTKVAETEDVVVEVGRLTQYLIDKLPALFDFVIEVILALLVFAIGVKAIGWIRKLIKKSLERANVDKGVGTFVDSMLKFGLYAILVFSIGKNFGLDTTSVAAAFASAGVAIGLALQGSLSNFAGGVMILILKPFVVGDYIIEDTNKCEGTVKEIQIFYTKLATADNRTIIIPNGTLVNNSLTNVTAQDKRRLDIKVDIAYDADLKRAKEVLEQRLNEEEGILHDCEKLVFVDMLGPSSVVIGVRGWVKSDDYWSVRWRMLENIKLALDENNIEIPFNQLTVHLDK